MAGPEGRWTRLIALDGEGKELEAINLDADPLVAAAVADLRHEVELARASDRAETELARLREQRGLKVHLGCGDDIRPGWVNIDLPGAAVADSDDPGATPVHFDLRRGLPLAEGSCELIYSSHLLGDMTYDEGFRLVRDSRRCLEPGGVLRLCLGDYAATLWAYLVRDRAYFEEFDRAHGEPLPELVTGLPAEVRGRALADYLNYGVYEYGRTKMIYDEENLELLLGRAGFERISRSTFKPEVDREWLLRRSYSFYVEAIR